MATDSPSTILVVDDEPAMCQALVELLDAEGYDVSYANEGAAGLAKAAELTPDLVLLDVKMPDMDGFTVCRRLRADPLLAEVPIIMITSLADRDSRLEGFEAGADDFISKPVDRGELLARVRTTTRLNRYRRLLVEQTRRRQAEEALQKSEEQYRALFEGVPIGLYRSTPEGRILDANPAMVEIMGYSDRASLLAGDVADLFADPEERCRRQALLEQDGAVHRFEFRLRRRDGTVIWAKDTGRGVRDGEGRVLYYEGSLEDITERKRAEQALQRQLEELVVLHAGASTGAEASDEDMLIKRATQIMDRMLGTDCFGVFLLDESAGLLRAHSSYRTYEREAPPAIPLGCDVIGQVAADGQPRRISGLSDGVERSGSDYLARSGLCVPLQVGERVIGVIHAASVAPDAFSEADERLLVTFAKQLATAIERVRLMSTLERRVADRTRELAALYDVTAVASESLDLQVTLERVLERTLEAIGGGVRGAAGSAAGAIHLLDGSDRTSGTNALRLVVQRGIPADVVAQADGIPVGSGLVGWVVERDESLIVPEVAVDPRASWVGWVKDCPIYVGVPVRGGDQVLGVLSVLLAKTKTPFKVEEMALLASIADHIGVVVENARLRRQTERAAVMGERARLARELHDSVTQSLYGLTLMAETGRRSVDAGDLGQATHYLTRLGETAQQALKEMRLMVYELRPVALEREGLVGALQQRLDAVEKRAEVKARLLVQGLPEGAVELPAWAEEELYRIAQEALNNSLKHAQASSVSVYIRVDGEGRRIALEVVDDGKGFDPDAVGSGGGMGLVTMRERAEKLGGVLQVISAPGEGTVVRITMEVSQWSEP